MDKIIRFVKLKHFLTSQVKGSYIPLYIRTYFKQELRKKIDVAIIHITPVNSKLIKMILKKLG